MTSKLKLSGKDYGDETTRLGLYLADVTSANFDARVASVAALQTAVNDVTIDGVFSGVAYNAIETTIGAKAVTKGAQREQKWHVPVVDGVDPLGNWSFEIGMADEDLLVTDGNTMNVVAGAGLALVQAIAAHCVSRLGNAVTCGPITLVGRNV
jgi:hypothetical protein